MKMAVSDLECGLHMSGLSAVMQVYHILLQLHTVALEKYTRFYPASILADLRCTMILVMRYIQSCFHVQDPLRLIVVFR